MLNILILNMACAFPLSLALIGSHKLLEVHILSKCIFFSGSRTNQPDGLGDVLDPDGTHGLLVASRSIHSHRDEIVVVRAHGIGHLQFGQPISLPFSHRGPLGRQLRGHERRLKVDCSGKLMKFLAKGNDIFYFYIIFSKKIASQINCTSFGTIILRPMGTLGRSCFSACISMKSLMLLQTRRSE